MGIERRILGGSQEGDENYCLFRDLRGTSAEGGYLLDRFRPTKKTPSRDRGNLLKLVPKVRSIKQQGNIM